LSSSRELLESIIGEISPNSETQNSTDFGDFQSPDEEWDKLLFFKSSD
jgi:hypothetical protein